MFGKRDYTVSSLFFIRIVKEGEIIENESWM
jgi:hypothetical protein